MVETKVELFMRIKLILLGAAICLVSNLALARTQAADIKSIQKQLQALKVQVKQIKTEQDKKSLQQQIRRLEKQIDQLKANRGVNYQGRPDYPYGPAIITSPYLGTRAAFDASDLITNTPDINEDLMLLQGRQKRTAFLRKTGRKMPEHPLLEISGYVEGQASTGNDYTGHPTNDIDLSGAELKILGEISPWATTYLVASYDNDVLKRPYSMQRVNNSRIYLSRAFLTVGNLDKAPVYGSIGQFYVPFGSYDSYMITDPFTKSIAITKQRPVLLGFSKCNFHTEAYAFKGDSYTGHNKTINNWGANLGYKIDVNKFNGEFGAGYIDNIADSDGMQNTYTPKGTFRGFGKESTTEKLQHQVPAADVNVDVGYGSLSLVGEYITALRSFSKNDLMFNHKGAKISALQTELNYKLQAWNKPVTFAAGYQQSWEALGLNIPEYSWLAAAGISLWKDTIEKLEYRHDINYKSGDTVTAKNVSQYPAGGKHRDINVVTFTMDFYF
jgi:hypothetical protein